MDYQQILTIVTAAIATAGGAATIASFGIAIIKAISLGRHTRALNANTKAKEEQTEAIVSAIDNNLNCTLDIDITSKIEPIVEDVRANYILQAKQTNEQLCAIKELTCENTKMLSDSPRVSRDEKLRLTGLVEKCEAIIVKDQPDTKNVVTLKLVDKVKEVATEIVKVANSVIDAVQV